MKRIIILSILLLSFLACGKKEEKITANEVKKIKIVTTLFPTYDFSKELGKDKIDVKLLLPPGVEAHAYEPTPKDISDINSADIFIYTGNLMEPWVEKLLKSISNEKLLVIDVSQGIELKEFIIEEDGHEHHDDEEHNHGKDPHIWTDPIMAKAIVNNIYEGLIKVDSENKSFYETNKTAYDLKLQELDDAFKDLVNNSKKKEIISGGHFVFGYLMDRYGLTYHSAYESFSPNAEPTPKQMKALKEAVKEVGSKYVYYEELIDPKLAKLLSEELGLQMLLLHGAHNLSKDELAKGITYYEIMQQNIENLKLGLDYGK